MNCDVLQVGLKSKLNIQSKQMTPRHTYMDRRRQMLYI